MAAEAPFVARPGQVDYSNIRYCPIINAIAHCQGKILVQQRSHGMRFHPGKWSGISGFLDTDDSVEAKVEEEFFEEAGLRATDIIKIQRGPVLVQEAPEYNKTWIVFPLVVEVKHQTVRHNWEAEQLRWVTLDEAKDLDLLDDFTDVLDAVKRFLG